MIPGRAPLLADLVADVLPGQMHHGVRAHRQAELDLDPILEVAAMKRIVPLQLSGP